MFDFQDKQNVGGVNDSRTPTKAGAREQNSRNQELKNAVESTGQTLTPISTQTDANVEQLAKAMFVYGCGSSRMQDNGTVNAIQLTPFTGGNGLRVPKASDGGYNILNGASVSFVPANENTGNVTINIGQTTSDFIGPKKLLTESGSEIPAGTIQTDGTYEAYYNSTADSGSGAWLLSSKPAVETQDLEDRVEDLEINKADRTELAQIGVGQTWQDVTSIRDSGVTYTNSTGKPILVHVRGEIRSGSNGREISIIVDGETVSSNVTDAGSDVQINTTITAIVPNGSTYSSTSTIGVFDYWKELR
jgi:hypothetical protein